MVWTVRILENGEMSMCDSLSRSVPGFERLRDPAGETDKMKDRKYNAHV